MLYKTAYLVVLCCSLMHMTMIGSDVIFFHTVNKDGTLAYFVSQSVAYLLYPLLGWLADVYFTRYKFILASFITMIVGTVLMIATASLFIAFNNARAALFLVGGLSLNVGLIAIGLFESTAIQFGMDQMLEASSEQLSTFIHWYYWSCNLGRHGFDLCALDQYSPSPSNVRGTVFSSTALARSTHVLTDESQAVSKVEE